MGFPPVHSCHSQISEGKGMRDMMKRALKRAAVGFPIGIAVGFLISWITKGERETLFSSEFIDRMGGLTMACIIQGLVSGFYGAVCMAGTICYDIDRWSLARATFTHYLIITVLYVPISLIMGWTKSAADILIVEAFQLVGFFLIWLIMYLRYRAEVMELNELMKEKGVESQK